MYTDKRGMDVNLNHCLLCSFLSFISILQEFVMSSPVACYHNPCHARSKKKDESGKAMRGLAHSQSQQREAQPKEWAGRLSVTECRRAGRRHGEPQAKHGMRAP